MTDPGSEPANAELRQLLIENQQRFLAFLVPRVGSLEEARDLLQAAFVRGLEKADSIREGESAVPWFYRLLRNALIDHYRSKGAQRGALEKYLAEAQLTVEEGQELESTVCGCVAGLTSTLKAEYAEAVQAVDLKGERVGEFAKRLGLTPNNAAVRLHRARSALGRRLIEMCGTCCAQGCRECQCSPAGA